jgi:hypothetical protein
MTYIVAAPPVASQHPPRWSFANDDPPCSQVCSQAGSDSAQEVRQLDLRVRGQVPLPDAGVVEIEQG